MIEEENDTEMKHLFHLCKYIQTCADPVEKESQVSHFLERIQEKIKKESSSLHPNDMDRMNKLCLIIRSKIKNIKKKQVMESGNMDETKNNKKRKRKKEQTNEQFEKN